MSEIRTRNARSKIYRSNNLDRAKQIIVDICAGVSGRHRYRCRVRAPEIEEIGKPPDEQSAELPKSLRTELIDADKRLMEVDGVLADVFPQYAEIANPKPATLGEAQQLLSPAEAILGLSSGYQGQLSLGGAAERSRDAQDRDQLRGLSQRGNRAPPLCNGQ